MLGSSKISTFPTCEYMKHSHTIFNRNEKAAFDTLHRSLGSSCTQKRLRNEMTFPVACSFSPHVTFCRNAACHTFAF